MRAHLKKELKKVKKKSYKSQNKLKKVILRWIENKMLTLEQRLL